MAKKNKTYWEQRAEAKVLDIEKMGLLYEEKMKADFINAASNVQGDITKLYVRYAKDNKLSYTETLKYLRNDERVEFQHDLEYYIKKASNTNYRLKHRQELQALSVRARVNRLEEMKANILMESEKLFNSLEKDTLDLYGKVYDEAYHRTAFDVIQRVGVGVAFNKPSSNTIKSLLEYPWSGKPYSQSLWDMEKGFVDSLYQTLTVGLIQGKSVQELSRQFRDEAIGKDFYKGKPKGALKKAQRLVRTETAFVLNQATSDMYDELNVDEYEFLGTLDSHTCEHCGGLDGKHYVLDKKQTGINYPPLHPYCRCTTVPYFSDDEDEDIGQRIARGADGKNYHIPADMTYEEWEKGLKNRGGSGILDKNIEMPPGGDKIKGMSPDLEQEIKRSTDKIMNEYDVRLDHFEISPISDERVPFQFTPINNGGFYESKITINSNYDFNGSLDNFTKRVLRNYHDGKIASKSIEGLMAHELAHVMSFQHVQKYGEFQRVEEELREKFVFDISEYADSKMDGSESLAEAFVRLRNGENIPDDVRPYVEEYIERWKKK